MPDWHVQRCRGGKDRQRRVSGDLLAGSPPEEAWYACASAGAENNDVALVCLGCLGDDLPYREARGSNHRSFGVDLLVPELTDGVVDQFRCLGLRELGESPASHLEAVHVEYVN